MSRIVGMGFFLLCKGCVDDVLLTATDTEEEPLLEAAIFTRRGSHSGSLSFEASFMRDIMGDPLVLKTTCLGKCQALAPRTEGPDIL